MRTAALLTALFSTAAAVSLAAQAPAAPATAQVSLKEEKAGLLAQVTFPDSAARRVAVARVPGGAVVKAELEREKGLLIYSYDVKVPGAEGITEVAVDAHSGKVVSVEHESAAEEAKEAGAEGQKKAS